MLQEEDNKVSDGILRFCEPSCLRTYFENTLDLCFRFCATFCVSPELDSRESRYLFVLSLRRLRASRRLEYYT